MSNITKDEELVGKIVEDFNLLSPLLSLINNTITKDPDVKVSINKIWKLSVPRPWEGPSNPQLPQYIPSSNAVDSSRTNVDRSSHNISMMMPSTKPQNSCCGLVVA